jgi:hypothetical protein
MSTISDLAGLSKPIEKLLEIGEKLLEPYFITRRAKADVKAALILHDGEVDLAERKRQAAERLVGQELQKHDNLTTILRKAIKHVDGSASISNDRVGPDADWIFRFGLEAQEISEETLQDLWARLLARASQSPAKYPRRLFHAVKDLEPAEVLMLDELATKALFVEGHDGTVVPFLSVNIFEEWSNKTSDDPTLLGSTLVEKARLLQELRILDSEDFIFRFTGEGYLRGGDFHLSGTSARRISSNVGEIVGEHQQPNFVSVDGATLGDCGIKTIMFDGWRITELGTALFSLSQKYSTDVLHLEALAHILRGAGMNLDLRRK